MIFLINDFFLRYLNGSEKMRCRYSAWVVVFLKTIYLAISHYTDF